MTINFNNNILGTIATVQLGEPSDSYWCPNAQVLLLAPEPNFHRLTFLGLAKKDNGDLLLLEGLSHNRMAAVQPEEGLGDLISSRAMTFSNGQYRKYCSVQRQRDIDDAVHFHRAVIEKLEAFSYLTKVN